MRPARLALIGGLAMCAALAGGAAWAYLTATGGGTGSASVGDLSGPTNVVATQPNPNLRTVHVSWTPPATPDGLTPSGYLVSRSDGTTSTPACGTVAGTASSCDDAGVASGTYTYVVTVTWHSWTAAGAASAPVTVAAPAATSFVLAASTSTPTAGVAFDVTMTATDQYGAAFPDFTGVQCIVFTGPGASPGPSAYSPTYPAGGSGCSGSAVTFTDGVATASVTLYAAAPTTMSATDAVTGRSGSTSFTVVPAAANKFAVSTSTSTPTAGTPFTATLRARDLYDNPVTSYAGTKTITWSGLATSPAPVNQAPAYPTSSVAFSGGVSTTTLSATAYAAGVNSFAATDASGAAGSTLVTVSATGATQLVLPITTARTAGTTFSLAITATDTYGNTATSYSGTKTLTWSGPGTAPNGTAPSYSSSAAFTGGTAAANVTLYKAESPSITVSDGTLSGSSGTFTVSPAAGAKLTFTTQPTSAVSTVAISPAPVVTVLDAYSNLATADASSVNLAIGTNPGTGTLSGTTVIPVSGGTAAFPGLSINRAGVGYTLVATDGTLTSATSSAFTISVGAARKLVFTAQPNGATGTTTTSYFPVQPAVAVQDAGGNTVTTYSTAITLTLSTNPTAAVLTCAANPVTPVSGVATFSQCRISKTGVGYAITAASGSLTSAVSNPFNVTGVAAKIAFTTQPGGGTAGVTWAAQPVVAVQDSTGVVVTADSSTIALGVTAGTGTAGAVLSCNATTITAINGVASYAGCTITRSGAGYTLTATRAGLTSVASTAFTIAAGPAVSMAVAQNFANGTMAGAVATTQPAVTFSDSYGNYATTYTSPVTLSITPGTGTSGAVLSCTANPTTAAAGTYYILYAGCSINLGGSGYTLTATTASLPTVTGPAFDVYQNAPALTLTNKAGGISGRAEVGDTIAITYPNAVPTGTFCGGWSGASPLTAVTVSFTSTGGDKISAITDTTQCTGTSGFRATSGLGTIDLGTNGKYFGTAGSFVSSTASWSSSTNTLTITLGTQSGGSVATAGSPTTTATYTPETSLGVPVTTIATAAKGIWF